MKITHQVYLYLSTVILVFKRLRQSCYQCEASLNYGLILCQKTTTNHESKSFSMEKKMSKG